MMPPFSHVFSKQLSSHEKESLFDFIKVKILEDTRVRFTTTPDEMQCKIPFFVSRGNPYGVFDTIQCTFETSESGNTVLRYKTSHVWSIITKLGVGLFFGVILFYVLDSNDIFWKISLYALLVILYILGLLWGAHRKNKKLFQKIIDYSESL